jgi:hypothetical protein
MNIQDIITSVVSPNLNKDIKKNIIISLIDNSGSTSWIYKNGQNVLKRELELYREDILSNTTDVHYMYSFEENFVNHGKINVMKGEKFVKLPDIIPMGGTYTAKPLLDIITKINTVTPDIVRIYTDGKTNSLEEEIKRVIDKFEKKNIKLEIIAISESNKDMSIITENEESKIPGMDLVNMVKNYVSSLKIFNKFHEYTPYIGAVSSNINKNCIKFMTVEINIPVITFITELVDKLNKHEITWGNDFIEFKKMLTEIGKLWSLLMIDFLDDHPFIINITSRLQTSIKDNLFTQERIINFIKYGFDCVKQNQPIIMTNFENRVKESSIKKTEFKDAVSALSTYGTALDANKVISMPNKNGVCIISKTSTIELKKDDSNLTVDKFGNVYFGIDTSEQAIRIGLRNYAKILGYPNARYSTSVIFMVLNQMALLYINGIDIDSDYMNELRKIAICQTSMEIMLDNGKYDGVGFYFNWKLGNLPKMHYSSKSTHTSLYTDKMINPFNLSETIWWALMMAMLNIYDEQLFNYKDAVISLGIEPTKTNFLDYIKKTYKYQLTGNPIFEKIEDVQMSIFTLDEFEENEKIFKLKNHIGIGGMPCNANTWYSKQEINIFIKTQGCVWCKYKTNKDDFEPVNNISGDIVIEKLSTKLCRPVELIDKQYNEAIISNTFNNLNVSNIMANKNKFKINLIGITGSGKTTSAEKISDIITANGGMAYIVSSDKWSKLGYNGKDLADIVNNEIVSVDKKIFDGIKVIIMDICNENGVNKNAFGFNFCEYNELIFYPNMNKDKYNEYEAWCLNNVISRPMYDTNSNYWLNPINAGLKVCIKVHNLKANKIKKMVGGKSNNFFLEKDQHNIIYKKIGDLANKYNNYLSTQNLDNDITNFLKNSKIII